MLRKIVYWILIAFTFIAVAYWFCRVIDVPFDMLLLKVKFWLVNKSLRFLLSRLGCCTGIFCIATIFIFIDPELAKMMMPPGASEGTPSSSGNWRQYRNWSSEKEGDSAPEPSTWSGSSSAPNEVQQPQGAPEASTGTSSQPAGPSQSEAGGPIRVSPSSPSSPTPSWFEGAMNDYQKRFGDPGEGSSSAPNQGQQQGSDVIEQQPPGVPGALPQGEGGAAPNQPAAEEMVLNLRGDVYRQLGIFLSIGRRSVQRNTYDRCWTELGGGTAPAEKLNALSAKLTELSVDDEIRGLLPGDRHKRLITALRTEGWLE